MTTELVKDHSAQIAEIERLLRAEKSAASEPLHILNAALADNMPACKLVELLGERFLADKGITTTGIIHKRGEDEEFKAWLNSQPEYLEFLKMKRS